MDDSRTYYQILGLERAATFDQVRTARARMLRLYHPDLHPNASEYEREEYNRQTKLVNKAYSVLSDSSERAAYDSRIDMQASASSYDNESHPEAAAPGHSSNSSYRYGDNAHNGGSERDRTSYEYSNNAKSYRSTEEQLYADARDYVVKNEDCTKQGLRRYLHDRPLTSLELDHRVASFLDRMCDEGILYKTTGGATRYHFVESDDDDDDDEDEDNDDSDVDYSASDSAEYEEAPSENAQVEIPRRPRKARSRRWIGIIGWLVVAGWAWHHFVGSPATQMPMTQSANGVSLRSGRMTAHQSAQHARDLGAEHSSASNALQPSPAESTIAPTAVEVSVPTPSLERTPPQLGVAANASTSGDSAQQDGPPDKASSSDWQIVHEVPPAYPISAARMGESGTTIVEVKLDADGSVIDAKVHESSGYHDLDRAAVRAVRKFEFAPADGKAANGGGTVLVPVAFRQQ